MTDRKFLFQANKIPKRKIKPVVYLIVEKGFTVSDEIVNMFKGFVLKKEKAELDHNPISILNLIRKKWKEEELTNKKGDFLVCLVNQYFSLYGFKELLKIRTHKDENLEFYDLPKNNYIFICYSKGKKKIKFSFKMQNDPSNIEVELDKSKVNQIETTNIDSEYRNLQ